MTIPVVQIESEIQSLSPSALIEMFSVDLTPYGGEFFRFYAGTSAISNALIWQGNTYDPMPAEAEGFDMSTQGTLPRPKIRIANPGGIMSAYALQMNDLLGCKITRLRTFARYLDAVNFPGGVNPDASPDQHLPDQMWFIDQKTSEDRDVIEWELSSAFDLNGVTLPLRQVIKNSCSWEYRGGECGFTGGFFDKSDQPTSDPTLDGCPKRLGSCKARFGADATLPYGGFPGVTRIG